MLGKHTQPYDHEVHEGSVRHLRMSVGKKRLAYFTICDNRLPTSISGLHPPLAKLLSRKYIDERALFTRLGKQLSCSAIGNAV